MMEKNDKVALIRRQMPKAVQDNFLDSRLKIVIFFS